ncbi:MAG: helix-turn-helix domain-containing protein [Octadecabacter sp.]
MTIYHYIECGLDNVFVEGLEPLVDDNGEEVIRIPRIAQLHAEIAVGIILQDGSMSGSELRFLRSEMGMTQSELARVVHRDKQSIGRWERNEAEMEPNAEIVIRGLAIERLKLKADASIEDHSRRSIPTAGLEEIRISAANETYRLIRNAA